MKRIIDFITNIEKDILLHLLAVGVITMLSTLIFKFCGCGIASAAYGWGVGYAAGIAKEIYDEVKYHNSDPKDLGVDAISATFVFVVLVLLMT